MASKAATQARAVTVPSRTVPAYAPPTAPATITHEPISQAESGKKALSPTHPLGTVKEG